MKIVLSLTTLTTLIFNTTWKIISSLTTLTTLILNTRYTVITDYADFNFTSDYANYADFHYLITHNFITLTTMILKTGCKIVLSLTTLTTLIFSTTWKITPLLTMLTIVILNTIYNFITYYADYAGFRDYRT